MPDVTWIRVRIEAPTDDFGAAAGFWASVSDSTVVTPHEGRVVLQPASGSPFVEVWATDRLRWSLSLVLESDDPAQLAERALHAGARRAGPDGFRSPGDFRFDIAAADSGAGRPPPVSFDGTTSRLDQICIDLPPRIFDAEVEFWSELTGWAVGRGGLEEFAWLARPDDLAVRLTFQRLGAGHRGRRGRAHLDLACADDVDALIGHHTALGATPGNRGRVWHTMTDPSGLSYCLTERDPISGVIERPL